MLGCSSSHSPSGAPAGGEKTYGSFEAKGSPASPANAGEFGRVPGLPPKDQVQSEQVKSGSR